MRPVTGAGKRAVTLPSYSVGGASPATRIKGMEGAKLTVTLKFDKDLAKNGSVMKIEVTAEKAK